MGRLGARRARLLAITAGLVCACAPGSNYDDLATGGVEDKTLEPPRPTFPVSVSILATKRPKLRWAPVDGATGAIVEMCRTRDCAKVSVTFEAQGREVVVPQDLEPGFWFWRLRSLAAGRRGTRPGPTWEMVVRGPGPAGSFDGPSGVVNDIDGDGRPDLATVGNKPNLVLLLYLGAPEIFSPQLLRTYELEPDESPLDPLAPMAFGGGVDMEGTGFPVLVDSTQGFPSASRGGPRVFVDQEDYFDLFPMKNTPGEPQTAPAYDLLTDFDGDGYGDVLVVDARGARIQLGRPGGGGPVIPLGAGATEGPAASADLNGDGLADAIVPTLVGDEAPVTIITGNARGVMDTETPLRIPGAKPRPRGLAAGDFDGNGLADVAIVAATTDATVLCVVPGDRGKTILAPLCAPPPAGATFDGQLAAGDLDDDGRDDLVVAIRRGTELALVTAKLEGGALVLGSIFGAGSGFRITTVWPGRPGRARWVTSNAAQDTLEVYEGLDRKVSLPRPPDITTGFGRALR